MSGRGRGQLPIGTGGPVLRSQNKKNLQFQTPANDVEATSDEGDGTVFNKEVDEFVNQRIDDEAERARRGLELLAKSPGAGKKSQNQQQNATSTSQTDAMNYAEVNQLIAERLDLQSRILTEQFSAMMINQMSGIRKSINDAYRQNAPQPEARPTGAFAASSEQNNSRDSYQNLFTQHPSMGGDRDAIVERSSSSTRSNFIRKEDFAEIKFDGKSIGVKQFLFKLRTLKEANDVSWEYVVKNFYRCVKGHADTWYWGLVQRMDNAGRQLTWPVLKDALENDFGGRQTDADISNMMWSRKQKYNESFEDFFEDIVSLNGCLSVCKPDLEIINILKTNCSNRIVSGVFNYTTTNARDFKRQCMKYEGEVDRRFKGTSKVSEIDDASKPPAMKNFSSSHENDPEVDEIRHPKERPRIQCNHCNEPVIFCYRCFTPNVTFPKCPNCQSSENSNRSGSHPTPNSHSHS